jgi:hypothetical protein
VLEVSPVWWKRHSEPDGRRFKSGPRYHPTCGICRARQCRGGESPHLELELGLLGQDLHAAQERSHELLPLVQAYAAETWDVAFDNARITLGKRDAGPDASAGETAVPVKALPEAAD